MVALTPWWLWTRDQRTEAAYALILGCWFVSESKAKRLGKKSSFFKKWILFDLLSIVAFLMKSKIWAITCWSGDNSVGDGDTFTVSRIKVDKSKAFLTLSIYFWPSSWLVKVERKDTKFRMKNLLSLMSLSLLICGRS